MLVILHGTYSVCHKFSKHDLASARQVHTSRQCLLQGGCWCNACSPLIKKERRIVWRGLDVCKHAVYELFTFASYTASWMLWRVHCDEPMCFRRADQKGESQWRKKSLALDSSIAVATREEYLDVCTISLMTLLEPLPLFHLSYEHL